MKTITIEESYNWFGDTVLTYKGESYNVFQYNCMNAKRLLSLLEDAKDIEMAFVVYIEEFIDETRVIVKSAIAYLREMIDLNDQVSKLNIPGNSSAGAEIAGRYGY